MGIKDRLLSQTPRFFRRVRMIGLCLIAAGGVPVAMPEAVPEMIVRISGYMIVAGSVMTAVSQTVVKNEE